MLLSAKDLKKMSLQAEDGQIGSLVTLFIDKKMWTVRYLVVRTGKFLAGKEVLVAPEAVRKVDAKEESVLVDMTRQEVRDSPDIDTHMPLSRRKEVELFNHYGWMPYWYPPGTAMSGVPGFNPLLSSEKMEKLKEKSETEDPDLRDLDAVTGYGIHAADGQAGHVEEFLVDTGPWILRQVVVDTRNWLPGGRKVLLPVEVIRELSWEKRTLSTDLTMRQVEDSPEYET
jgi:hypothetical protein